MPTQSGPSVIFISIDGLRTGDETRNLQTLIDAGELPNFARLQAQGAWTHNARTDPFHTNTIPNHSTMLTGRPVEDATGAPGHRFRANTDTDEFPDVPVPGVNLSTLHTSAGEYIPSVFNVAHDRGYSTALYASKSKFSLYNESYDGVDGETDPAFEREGRARDTVGADDGFDKLDRYFQSGNVSTVMDRLEADKAASGLADFTFLHIRSPDSAGHDQEWGSPAYLQAIRDSDAQLGRIFEMIDSDPALKNNTFIILTADHGGGGDVVTEDNHGNPNSPLNFTIPFYVWGPGVAAGADLYDMNPQRRVEPDANTNPQQVTVDRPIRNGDGGNLALDLMGLPAIPTSSLNAPQDLNPFGVINTFGGAGANVLIGGTGPDGLHGEGGADRLVGGAGADGLEGGDGDDVMQGGTGNDRLNGGDGRDTASYADATQGVRVSLAIDGAQATGAGVDRLIAVERLTGGRFADVLTGDDRPNTLAGEDGADILEGGGGNDLLRGGLGVDQLDGGAGWDVADFREKTGAVVVDLRGAYDAQATMGGGPADTLRNIEGVYGGSGDDVLTGDGFANAFYGFAGDDVLQGDWGIDFLDGGAGMDMADFSEKNGAVVVTLNGANAVSATMGGGRADTLRNIEGVLGGSGGDTLIGDDRDNRFIGAGGDDRLTGAGGDDRLDGGTGSDRLTGGSGADVFDLSAAVAGRDVAEDFSRSEGDRIDLAGRRFNSLTIGDVNGDGLADSQLGYSGGTFVALGVSDMNLAEWNGLLI